MSDTRWDDLRAFIAEWRKNPIRDGDGYTAEEIAAAEERLGVRLPEALRELYALAGRRDDLFRRQDALRTLDELEFDQGWLWVWYENQGVWECVIAERDMEEPDPPVTMLVDGTPYSMPLAGAPMTMLVEGVSSVNSEHRSLRLSEVALERAAFETVLVGDYCASGGAGGESHPQPERIGGLKAQGIPLPQRVLNESGFLQIGKVLAFPMEAEIWIAARSEAELNETIKEWDDLDWSYISTEDG